MIIKVKKYTALLILGVTYLTRHGLWRMAVDWADRDRRRLGEDND